MARKTSKTSLGSAVAALSILTSSVPNAAPAFANASHASNPLVTLSIVGSASSRAALCATGAAAVAGAASTAVVQPAPGCVLPAVDAPPPAVVENVPAPVAPYVPAPAGPNIWPLLASLAAFSAVFFLLDDVIVGDDDFFEINRPVSPS